MNAFRELAVGLDSRFLEASQLSSQGPVALTTARASTARRSPEIRSAPRRRTRRS